MKALFLTAAAVLAVLAVGCVEGESFEPELAGDGIGEAPQALGDEGCGTLNMSTLDPADGAINSTVSVQTSPDWTYNPGPTCPYQYVVEYTNLPAASGNSDLQIWAQPKGGWQNITNEADCERTHVLAGYYVWSNIFTLTPGIHTVEAHGTWSNGGGGIGPGCTPSYVGTPPSVDGKLKVRVAARNLFCAYSDGCNDTQRTDLKVETRPDWYLINP